jgi:hypothetical protein
LVLQTGEWSALLFGVGNEFVDIFDVEKKIIICSYLDDQKDGRIILK